MRRYFKNGSSFPDYSGDGTITQKDILMGKGVIPKAKMMGGGSVKRMGLKAGSANPKATSETAKKQAKAGMESQKSTNKKALKIAKNISKLNPLTFGIATALDTSKKDKKNDRIAAGSGETMRKVGSVGAPTAQNFKDAAKTAKKV